MNYLTRFLIISALLIYLYEDSGKYLYTALGDSLASGVAAFGKRGYVYNYHRWLNMNKFGSKLKLYNAGVLYLDSAGLLNNLYNNGRLQEAVRKSDIITLDIGANDMIKARYSAEMLKQSSEMFEINFNNILRSIRTLNGNCQLYVMDIYNPYPQDSELFGITEEWVKRFNNTIHCACNNKSYGVNGLAEVYNAFKGNELQYTLINVGNKHPNVLGHSVISWCFEQVTV